jgi:hypothetical protein
MLTITLIYGPQISQMDAEKLSAKNLRKSAQSAGTLIHYLQKSLRSAGAEIRPIILIVNKGVFINNRSII